MIREQIDLWEIQCDARCITTNGSIRNDGMAVMGRGCAFEATERFPTVQRNLGQLISQNGNHVQKIFRTGTSSGRFWHLVSFPVKHRWDQKADLELIERSAQELVEMTGSMGWETVALPRPGCGNGKLSWHQVRPILKDLLDDRFVIVTPPVFPPVFQP